MDIPLFREITTINPIESYHSMVRRYTNNNMNLKECTFNIVKLIEKRYETAQMVAPILLMDVYDAFLIVGRKDPMLLLQMNGLISNNGNGIELIVWMR